MDYEMRAFVLCNLKRNLPTAVSNAEPGTPTAPMVQTVGDQAWLNQMNQWLRNAEAGSISREDVTAVNPHLHIKKGSALKVFLKRIIRKMVYWLLQPMVVQQSGYNSLNNDITNQLRDSLCVLKDVVASQQATIQDLAQRLEAANGRIAQIESSVPGQINKLNGQAQTASRELCEQKQKLSVAMEQLDEVSVRVTGLKQPEETVYDYMDYAQFEEKFRGTQQEIRSRNQRYLAYFSAGDKVVDLGCGRGEWLEQLKSIGAEAVGVDLNEKTVALCRKKGLQVEQDDLFHYLEQVEDSSLDGITSIQVIEHLTPPQLLRLAQLCYRKMKFGGRLIFETQNPAVVFTMTNNFWPDPTHIRPVHPQWAKYALEDAGFSDVTLDYPEYALVNAGSIPALEIPNCDTTAFNQQIDFLNNLLYGSTDYAVICVKK